MHAAVIHFRTLDVYARCIYYCGMEPEVAKYHFGALALAVADSIASVSASFSPSGPATAVMVFLSMEPGLPISVLASRIRLSHAGTVRLIDRLEHEQLVERRRHIADRRARFIHLTNSGKKITEALLKAREQVISECVSPLSPNDLDILGVLSERLFVANGFDKDGSISLCHLCGYSRIAPSRSKAKPGAHDAGTSHQTADDMIRQA
ncbi:MarR family transcriptional regulator [Labrys neptuniae]|uniref:MarR family transcriptional regulator n=2 Tax=Pseudomonadota TaxID=1224 RepID=A0ABU9ZVZ0_9HYPH|nr:MarR family transcriptional regulator [Labrys neptuniae]MDT3378160.1 MarR family transcriptional regulator [Labrys neptuniae]